MKNIRGTKLFIAILATTSFIFCFSQFGAYAYTSYIKKNTGYEEQTTIASINIAGMSNKEAYEALTNAVAEWKKSAVIQLKYKEKTATLDLGVFTFSTKDSITNLSSGQDNIVTVFLDEDAINVALNTISSELVEEDSFYLNRLNTRLIGIASSLQDGEMLIDLTEYKVSQSEEKVLISEGTIDVSDNKKNIEKWVKQYPSLELVSNSSVSLIALLEETNGKTFSDETWSMVATAIHQVILSTNFSITERATSKELPVYSLLGYEAKVNKEKEIDYQFYNPNETDYIFTFKLVEDQLYVALTGPPFLYEYRTVLSDEESFERESVIIFDPALNFNEFKTVEEGKDGQLVKVYREAVDENGETVKKELISEDFYAPVNTVIAHSLLRKTEVTIQSTNTSIEESEESSDETEELQTEEESVVTNEELDEEQNSGESDSDETNEAVDDTNETDGEETGDAIEK